MKISQSCTIVLILTTIFIRCQLPFEKEQTAEIKSQLLQLETDKIKHVTVLLWVCEGENPVTLKSEHWPGLVKQLHDLQPTKNVSAKTTNIYRVLDIETTYSKEYRIYIGNAYKSARLVARIGPDWNQIYFEAADLWAWLQSIDAVKNQKKSQSTPC